MYDVIIIGSGGSALTSAITLKQKGKKVLILSKVSNTASQTSQAQGGINAVINKNDNINDHINDTLNSSKNLGNKEAIKYMCTNAKDCIQWLDTLGVPFSRDNNNQIAQRKLGASSFNRACYSSDYTGLKILQSLFDTALQLGIEFKEEYFLLDIIIENNTTKGIVALNLKNTQIEQILSKSVIIASGGYAGVYHNFTTNSSASTGDGQIAALNANCTLENMEFIQFHPTALLDRFILISESARGEGGYLVTSDSKRFVDELLPRDIVAREIYKKILLKEEVFLDLRHLGLEKIMKLMPQEYKLCLEFKNLHMHKDLIPIIPASHYSMGGIQVDLQGNTSINNLYAVGECASNGVHGANRLGGNSLLEIITFGRYVASNINVDNIIIEDKIYNEYNESVKYIDTLFVNKSKENFYTIKDEIGKLMFENVGLFRNEKSLINSLNIVNNHLKNIHNYTIEDKSKVYNTNLKEYLEFHNILKLSKIIIKSALNRKESRGAHFRVDFDKVDSNYNKVSISNKGDLNDEN